jgi:LytR cell envelope-related transcriptional attenuator
MVYPVPEPKWRRRIDLLAGAAIVILGFVVAVVAVVAVAAVDRQPAGRQAAHTGTPGSAANAQTPTVPSTSAPGPPFADPSAGGAAASTHSSATASASAATPSAALRSTPLIVLNSTSRVGLAHTAAKRFVAAGWTVKTTGTIVNSIISTCAYYDPKIADSQQAATALRQEFQAIKRVEPKFDGLPSGPVVVVLTTDYS